MVVANALIDKPELALNVHNVAYMLGRLKGSEKTVAEALASRGGVEGLVEDLRQVVALRYPLVRLEYLLDSLAGCPRPECQPEAAAKFAVDDQGLAVPQAIRLQGARPTMPVQGPAEFVRADDVRPYREVAEFIDIEPPVRAYLGENLQPLFALPEGDLRPEILEDLSDLRGELVRRFGITPPYVSFHESTGGQPSTNEFRIEVLDQTPEYDDAKAILIRASQPADKQFMDELRWRELAYRTRWITADYVDQHLEGKEIKPWLLSRYSLTDIKTLLRGVVAPPEAELDAYKTGGVDSALQHAVPGQSLRQLDWLLASLAFWWQAYDAHDADQLVQALRETQAARLAPNPTAPPDRAVTAILNAEIDALEQHDFVRAEKQFGKALAADRAAAVATFAAVYAAREAKKVGGRVNDLINFCVPFEPPGKLKEHSSVREETRFEIENILMRYRDQIAAQDQVSLEYCLLEHYAAKRYFGHVRADLDNFRANELISKLTPNEKYTLGYWTLELHGRSFAPPSDLDIAEAWLSSAFREWTPSAQDMKTAAAAMNELLNRYENGQPPRWYVDMLQRLGKLRPKEFDIAYALGNTLAGGRDLADTDQGLEWLERAKAQLKGPTITIVDRPRLSAWVDRLIAGSYLTRARVSAGNVSEASAQEATSRLQALIQDLKNRGVIADKEWPGAEAYTTLIDTYRIRKQFDKAAKAFEASRQDGLVHVPVLLGSELVTLLATNRTDEALELSKAALDVPGLIEDDRQDALFFNSMLLILTHQPDAEFKARQFLATQHPYVNNIRLMIYWHLARQGKVDQAKAYLNDRWKRVDRSSWPERLNQGDPEVWRERLVGYYLGLVSRDEIFDPLKNEEAFKASGLSNIGVYGLSLGGMRAEAHFYDALLQEVTGERATRATRFRQALGDVLEVGQGDEYEYAMAQYLHHRIRSRNLTAHVRRTRCHPRRTRPRASPTSVKRTSGRWVMPNAPAGVPASGLGVPM